MTITYTIPGATLLDQLSPTTLDGLPNSNAQDNCVPTSIAEGLHILTGRAFDGDELKDAVYGVSYVGFQSAARYVTYCAGMGISLTPHNDTQAGLIATIHAQVSTGHPVIVTMPSQWGTAPADPVHPSGTTHVGIAVGVGPGMIRVMNPWHGFFQDQSDAWWQARLCEGQVWVMQKAGASVTTVIPTGWKDDGKVLTAPNGLTVTTGFRLFILDPANNWPAGEWPVSPELTVDYIMLTPDGGTGWGAGTVQYFQHSALGWSRAKNQIIREQVGLDAYYMRGHIDDLDKQIATLETKLETQAQKDAATIGAQSGQIATLTAQMASLKAQVKNLTAQLANAQTTAQATKPAPTTPADAAALLVSLIYAEANATIKAASQAPATTPTTAG